VVALSRHALKFSFFEEANIQYQKPALKRKDTYQNCLCTSHHINGMNCRIYHSPSSACLLIFCVANMPTPGGRMITTGLRNLAIAGLLDRLCLLIVIPRTFRDKALKGICDLIFDLSDSVKLLILKESQYQRRNLGSKKNGQDNWCLIGANLKVNGCDEFARLSRCAQNKIPCFLLKRRVFFPPTNQAF